jgi:coiled-coil domain-containing protein 130
MQGFNMGRYVPPEFEGTTSANKLAGKHALGSRANKSSQGILTVRFEMPYPIWCTTCPKPTIIGQGVRFNAEKKKVGNYYSTPIFSFRMKHTACGGSIEIRTDPKNTAYVVTEGARKRDTGEDKVEEGEIKILTPEEREKLRSDAFASLEGKVEDKRRLEHSKLRLEELQDLQDEQWEDPYEQSKRLRRAFRADRKVREHQAEITGALQDKMSLGIELLPDREEDIRRAGLIEFGGVDAEEAMAKAVSRPMFDGASPEKKPKTKALPRTKAAELSAKRREDFAKQVQSNTRAVLDPFLMGNRASDVPKGISRKIPGVKRKREADEDSVPKVAAASNIGIALVDYESD